MLGPVGLFSAPRRSIHRKRGTSLALCLSLSLTAVQEAPRGRTPALTAQFSFHNARNWIFLLYHDVLLYEFCSLLVQQRQVRYDIGRSCREQGHLRIQTVIISQLSYPSLQKIIRFFIFFPFFGGREADFLGLVCTCGVRAKTHGCTHISCTHANRQIETQPLVLCLSLAKRPRSWSETRIIILIIAL